MTWRRRSGSASAAILVYHRVRASVIDPFGMAVAPDRFREQMVALRASRRPIVPLVELAHSNGDGLAHPGAVAVTFDDGYADNLDAASVLAALDIPATVFVATDAIGTDVMWWDRLADLLLRPVDATGPAAIRIAGRDYAVDLGPGVDPWAHPAWRITTKTHPTPRHAALRLLWELAMSTSGDERDGVLSAVAAVLPPAPCPAHRPMTAAELVALEASAPVTVGSHTMTHRSLTRAVHRDRDVELEQARQVAAAIVGHPIDAVAYPHGHADPDVASAARRAGHTVGVARGDVPVGPTPDVMRLPRIDVGDWDGDVLLRRLPA